MNTRAIFPCMLTAFALAALACRDASAPPAPTPSVTRLEVPTSEATLVITHQDLCQCPGEANDVNEQGWVVGWASFDPALPPQAPFLWKPGSGMQALDPNLAGSANALNETGWVVGGASTVAGTRAFVSKPGAGVLILGTLGGTLSEAFGVNDGGDVVGVSTDASGVLHGFRWRSGSGMIDLGPMDHAMRVTEGHEIVGSAPIGGIMSAVRRDPQGVFTRMAGWPGRETVANAMNLKGQVAGYVAAHLLLDPFPWGNVVTGFRPLAFVATGAGWQFLPTLPRGEHNAAFDINVDGDVVGISQHDLPYYRYWDAFLWTPRLGTVALYNSRGPEMTVAHAINNHRIIVGSYICCGLSVPRMWTVTLAP